MIIVILFLFLSLQFLKLIVEFDLCEPLLRYILLLSICMSVFSRVEIFVCLPWDPLEI